MSRTPPRDDGVSGPPFKREKEKKATGTGASQSVAMNWALLFDLDETLMVEGPAASASFAAVAEFAATVRDIDARHLAQGARDRARELWYESPTIEYCLRVGISSWEGLWCRYEGDGSEVRSLREWAPAYRQETWRLALSDQGIDDPGLAAELGDRFGTERRARHELFEDAAETLASLRRGHSMALVTNGAACLQREKLAASGLGDYFDAVVVSEDLGVAKPEAAVFERALSMIGADRDRAVMIGDSLSKDVDGALAAGLQAIWLNREPGRAQGSRQDRIEISTLRDLPEAVSLLTGSTSQGRDQSSAAPSRRPGPSVV
jgi:putative hydrolase of the HAD superfamily